MATLYVGSTENYTTLTAAIGAAQNGDTIVLKENISETTVSIDGKDLAVDLGGFTLDAQVYLKEDSDVEFKNGSMTYTNTNPAFDCSVITTGIYTDEKGNTQSSGGSSALTLTNVKVEGGEVVNSRRLIHAVTYKSTGGLTVTDSTITGGTATRNADCESIGNVSSGAYGIHAPSGSAGKIEITNSTVTGGYGKTDAEWNGYVSQLFSPGGYGISLHGTSEVTITDSTVNGGGSNWYNAGLAINVSNQFSGTLDVVDSAVTGGKAEGQVGNYGQGGVGIYTSMSTSCEKIDITGSTITGGDGGKSSNATGIDYRNKDIQMNITDSTVAAGNGENASGGGAAIGIYNSDSTQVVLDNVKLNGEGNGSNTVIKGGDKGITVVGPVEITGGELINTVVNVNASGLNGSEAIISGATDGVEVNVTGNEDAVVIVDGGKTYVTTETDPTAADTSTVYVNSNWADKEANAMVGVGKFFGVNAFADLNSAVAAAENEATIIVSGDVSGKAVFADGKNLTITGTADFAWGDGNSYFFVGRGSDDAVDTTVTFKDAVIGSSTNSTAYGFNIAQSEGAGSGKADGTVNIDNSSIVTDYMQNRNIVNVKGDGIADGVYGKDGEANLFVKNYFAVSRDNNDTKSAEMNLTDGAYVKIDNENGAGIGYSGGRGVLNITDSKFEAMNDLTVANSNAAVNVTDGILEVGKTFTNNGTVNVSGKSSLQLGTISGDGVIDIAAGTTLVDTVITAGNINRNSGTVYFEGANKLTGNFSNNPADWDIVINKGASLEIARGNYVLGYDRDITINGLIKDATGLTADDLANTILSFKTNSSSGFSVGGTGTNVVTVNDAYVDFANTSWKNSYATHTWSFTNSYVAAVSFGNNNAGATDTASWTVTFDDSVLAAKYIKTGKGMIYNFTNGSQATAESMRIDGELNVSGGSKVVLSAYQNNTKGAQDEHGDISGKVVVDNATLDIDSNAKTQIELLKGADVTVKNKGTLNLNEHTLDIMEGAEFNVENTTFEAVEVNNAGEITIDGAHFSVDTVNNNGTVNISGESNINGTFAGKAVKFADGTILTSTDGVKFDNSLSGADMTFGKGDFDMNSFYVYSNDDVVFAEGADVDVATTFATYDGGTVKVEKGAVADALSIYFNGGNIEVSGKLSAKKISDGGFILNGADDTVTINKGGVLDVNYVDIGKASGNSTVEVYGEAKTSFKLSDGNVGGKFTWNIYDGGSLTAEKYGIEMNNAESAINIYGDVTAAQVSNAGSITVTGGTLDVGTLTNGGTVNISGASDIKAAVTGDGWFYMNNVTLDSDTNITGANIRFASGLDNVVDGAVLNIGRAGKFQVGAGDKLTSATDERDANVDFKKGVAVTVKNSKISGTGSSAPYGGWVGSEYCSGFSKSEIMTDARFTLKIENSTADFGYLHVSTDGILKISGAASEKMTYSRGDIPKFEFDSYIGDFTVNGEAELSNTSIQTLYTKVYNKLTVSGSTLYAVGGDPRQNGITVNGGELKVSNASEVYANHFSVTDGTVTLNGDDVTLTMFGLNATKNVNNGIIKIESGAKLVGAKLNDGYVPPVNYNLSNYVTFTNNKDITITGGMMDIDNIVNAGTITVTAKSVGDTAAITAGSITGDGTITVDAKGFSGIKKVIDITGDGDAVEVAVTGNAKAYAVTDGEDTYVTTADKTSILLDAAASDENFGNVVDADGKYIAGVNAFDSADEAINAMTAATKTIYVNGTVEGQWPVKGITIDKDLKFEAVNGAPATIIANGGMYGAAIAANMTLGAGVTLNTAPDQKTQNFCGYGADGKDITLDINGIWQNGGGDFGSRKPDATGTVAVKVGSTGKFISVGLDNTSFLANSIVNVTGTGNAKTKAKMEEIQFVSGVNTSMNGKVDMVNTNVLFGGYTPYGNLAFSGDDSMTVSNSIFTVVCNTVIGIDEDGQAVYRNDDKNSEIVYGNLTINKNATFTDSELNVANLMIGGKTFTVNGGVVNAHAAYWDDSAANGSNANKNWAGDITIAEGTVLTMTNATLNAEGTVTNDGDFTVSGTSKLDIGKLTGAIVAKDDTVLKGGTSVKGGSVVFEKDLTIGESADDIVTIDKLTNIDNVFDGGNLTVNGTLNICSPDAPGAYPNQQLSIVGGDGSTVTKLTGKGTINVNTTAIFQGENDGNILIDKDITVNVNDVPNAHLRFTCTNLTIDGTVNKKGTQGSDLTAMTAANVTVNGSLTLAGGLTVGYVENALTEHGISSSANLTVKGNFSAGGKVEILEGSSVTVNGGNFSADSLTNKGTFTLNGGTVNASTLTNSGAFTIAANGVYNQTGGNFRMVTGATFTVAANGAYNQTGGNFWLQGGDMVVQGYAEGKQLGNAYTYGSITVDGTYAAKGNNGKFIVDKLTIQNNGSLNVVKGGYFESKGALSTMPGAATITVDNSTFIAKSVSNSGSFIVKGASTLEIGGFSGSAAIKVADGAKLSGNIGSIEEGTGKVYGVNLNLDGTAALTDKANFFGEIQGNNLSIGKNYSGSLQVTTKGDAALVIAAGAVLDSNDKISGNVKLLGNITVNNADFEAAVTGNKNITVSSGILNLKAGSQVNMVTIGGESRNGVTIAGTVQNVTIKGNFNTLLLNNGAELKTITIDGNVEHKSLFAGLSVLDSFGTAAVSGKNNAVLTVASAVFKGNTVKGVKLNLTNVGVDNDVDVAADVALSDIKSINENAVKSVNGVYFYTDADEKTYILNKVDGGVDIVKAGSDSGDADVFEEEMGNFTLTGDLAAFDVTMKSGNTTLKVANGDSASIGTIEKSINGGVNNVTVGNDSVLTVDTIERMGNITVGKNGSEMTVKDELTGTSAAETIAIGDNSDFESKGIDFAAGKATFKLGKNADATVDGDFTVDGANNTITLAADAGMKITGNIINNCGDNYDAVNGTVKYATTFGTTINLGKGAVMLVGKFDDDTDSVTTTDVIGLAGLTLASGSAAKFDRNGNEIAEEVNTIFAAGDVYGTEKNNTINVGNFGIFTANSINMFDGNDTIKVGNDSEFVVATFDQQGNKDYADIVNVETISIGARSGFAAEDIIGVNKLTAANGSYDKKADEITYTVLGTEGFIEGTAKNDTISLGNWNHAVINGIDLLDGNDTLKLGSDSVLVVGKDPQGAGNLDTADIANVETISIGARSQVVAEAITGVNKLTAANGVKDDTTQILATGTVTGTAKNDTISLGNWSAAAINGIDLLDGNDTLKIGNDSMLTVAGTTGYADIANVETISIGARSRFAAKDITGVNKLTAANGSYDKKTDVTSWTKVTAGVVTGTEKNDTVTFGNYNDVKLDGINLDAGNDTLKIGNDSIVDLGAVDFGDGKDTMTIGKNSVVTFTSLEGVETLNVTKGAEIWFNNDAADVDLTGVKGSWKNATIYDMQGEITLAGGGSVYANEWDVYDLGTSTLESIGVTPDSGVKVEVLVDSEWVAYDSKLTYANTQIRVGVNADLFDKKDQYDKESYTFTATLA